MNTEPRFLLGKPSDGTPIVVTRLKEGVAFELVHIKLAQAYAQIDAIGFPPRPSGTPRTVAAGERVACFRCEAQALEAAALLQMAKSAIAPLPSATLAAGSNRWRSAT